MEFDGAQILSTFLKMEEEVSKFYSQLAENAGDEKSRKLFERLAEEEDKHHKMYSKLLEKHSKDMVRKFSEEEIEYTNALIDENIKEKQEFNASMKLKDALDIAEQMEKDGILFVYQMKSLYPDIAQKEMETILREEKRHLQIVRDRKQFSPLRSLGL